MFQGYGFFDYKGHIAGYSGQDYDGMGHYIYLIVSVVLIVLFSILFRKAKKDSVTMFLRIAGIGLTVLYLIKTIWESYFDIATGQGFNTGILPFDTCSLIMPTTIIAGFAKGKAQKAASAWIATGGIAGGISNLLFLQALKYYPFFTFAAFYSMLWHFLMVFVGVWLWVTHYVDANFKTVLYAFVAHMIFSAFVIPYDYATMQDFMLYLRAGGIPLVETLGEKLAELNLYWVTTAMMIALYFGAFALITYVVKGIQALIALGKHKKEPVKENE